MPSGKLLLTVRRGYDTLPVGNCVVTVTDQNGNTVFEETLPPQASGLSETLTVETPPIDRSLDKDNKMPTYSLLNATIREDCSYRMQVNGLQLFGDNTAALPVELIPLPQEANMPEDVPEIVINIPEHILLSAEEVPQAKEAFAGSDEKAIPTAVSTTRSVYIPETITVHLGRPESSAQNVTVSFIDYIKNVACSEIYPTWPAEALKANIIAQISITLNRVYTEWYRSNGLDFDITNSTAYDQAFVYGRNIFSDISDLVDSIFNTYITRPFSVEPLFAQYCNGTTSVCAGMSQWGTVALAESGLTSSDILSFYYGDIKLNESTDIRAITESYPGSPLSAGSTGRDVLIIQEQLNRIAVNYPEIPLNEATAVYDERTVNAVKTFQRLFVLTQTGIVDKGTWYRIAYLYTSVKRLAQITSEGQRASYNEQVYPGSPIGVGSKGSEVQEIQFYLYRINLFNPAVLPSAIDGIYGSATKNALISFQRAYGLDQTGTVDEMTWNKLVSVYNGTVDNIDEPIYVAETQPYPGLVIKRGMNGASVLYIQKLLNNVNDIFIPIPTLAEDGAFGPLTEKAVNTFAQLFGYPVNGEVDEALWNKMNAIYVSVASRCIFTTPEGTGTRSYPGTPFAVGSSGDDVKYIQSKINTMYSAVPYVGELILDGIYGAKTEASVIAAQKVFGFTQTGIVNEPNWLLLNYIYIAVTSGCLKKSVYASTSETEEKAVMAAWRGLSPDELNLSGKTEITDGELRELMRRNGMNVSNLFFVGYRRALMKWQSENGLRATGRADGETVALLKKKQKKN